MATVTLREVRIQPVQHPEDEVLVPIFGGLTAVEEVPGEVRDRASGRRVVVRRARARTAIDIPLPEVDREDADRLGSWTGEVIMIRDPATPVGRLLYGVFLKSQVEEIDGGDVVNVTISIEEVSFDLEV